MRHIFMERNFRPIEHRRLIHVIPGMQVLCTAAVLIVVEFRRPPFPDVGVQEVWPAGGACN